MYFDTGPILEQQGQSSKTVTYEYLPKQLLFMQYCDVIPFPAYIGGFGSGKTHVLVLQTLRYSTTPSRGLIGAPTYRMLEDTTQRKFFELCPSNWIYEFRKASNVVRLTNGTEILFRSMDSPGRLSSLEFDWWAVDEIGEVSLETFRMLQGRSRKVGGIHRGIVVGNPAGLAHWTYDYYIKLAAQYPTRYRLVQASSYENTFLSTEYTLDMEISFGVNTPYYRQFVLGEFCAFEGAYWQNFSLATYPQGHIIDPKQVYSLFKSVPHFGRVIDFGHEHPFVCLWYVTDNHTIVFIDEYHKRHGLIREHVYEINRKEQLLQARYGAHNTIVNYTDHEAQVRAEIANCRDDQGELIGFDCIPAEKRVMEGILLVQTLFEKKQCLITLDCPETLREVPSYRAKQNSTKEEPVKEKDDTCDCVRMACWEECRGTMTFKRYDSGSVVPDNLYDDLREPVSVENMVSVQQRLKQQYERTKDIYDD
jgi:PBSX family phage terminase large subunit